MKITKALLEERARNVANGIEVLATRLSREVAAQADRAKRLEEALRDALADLTGMASA